MNVLQSFGSDKTFASSALCFLLRPGISYDVFTSVSMKHDLIILQGCLRARVLSRPFCFLDIKKLIFLQWLITLCMEWLLCEIMISIQVFPLIMSLSFSRMLTWLSSTQVSCQSGCRTLNPFFLLISPLCRHNIYRKKLYFPSDSPTLSENLDFVQQWEWVCLMQIYVEIL